MTKVLDLNKSIIFAVVLSAVLFLSIAVAIPVGAQEKIKEECTLTRDIKIDGATISAGAVVKDGTTALSGTMTGTVAIKKWGTVCLINTINTLTDWAFFILLTISFVFIAVAGFMWMTSGGDAEKQKTAGTMILAALVGIVIAVIARIVPAVLTGVLL